MARPFLLSARAFAGRLLISLLVVSSLTVAGVAAVNRGIDDRIQKVHRIPLTLAPAPPEGANYVIVGSDTRAVVSAPDASGFGDTVTNPGQRSDTLMVAHVEPGAQRTFVVSFPRDLLVDIPGVGKAKINAAYDNGGPKKVVETLEANFPGLKINYYVGVDFRSFKGVVDAIGSVGVYFPQLTRDFDPDPKGGATDFETPKAGCMRLDGDTALQYVRSRHLQEFDPVAGKWVAIGADAPDIHRIERQQAFIRELAGIAIDKSLGDPITALDISEQVTGFLDFDEGLGRPQINELIRAFRTVDVNDPNSIEFATLPWIVNPSQAYGATLLPKPGDTDDLIARLQTFGNTPPPPKVVPSQVRVRVIDATDKGFQKAVRDSLVNQGFVAAGTGIEKFPVQTTDIRYAPNQVEGAKLLLDYFPDARLVPDPLVSDFVIVVLGANFDGELTVPTTAPEGPTSTTVATETTVAPAPIPTTTTVPSALTLGSPC
ncbi:MAG: LCP family protein [Acidimicrobiia bacterium]